MNKNLIAIAIAMGLAVPAAHATNGMFVIGYGNKSTAMGGAAIANPQDSLTGAVNPAGISGMGNRFDAGMDVFYVDVESCLGSVCAESEAAINGMGLNKTFLMPALGITYQWNDDITLGFSMVPAGGGGTKFYTNFFEAASQGSTNIATINDKLGVDLLVMEMNPTIAYKLSEDQSVGASLIMAVSRFNAYGIGLFDPFTQTQGTLNDFSNQGNDWSWGAGIRLGWMGSFDKLTLGASYSSKVYFEEYNHYEELFAEHGDLDVPAILGIGASYEFTDDLLVAMDVTYTFYEDVKAIGNAGPNLVSPVLGSDDRKLGLPQGLGFGWNNQTVIKLGTQYNYSEKVILRAGWNYGKSPVDEDKDIIFNLLAPAVTQHHLTFGGTYNLSSDEEINLSFIHAFEFTQTGPTYVSDDGSNVGSLSMSQYSIGAGYSLKF